MSTSLPSNASVPSNPAITAKIDALRNQSLPSSKVRTLVGELTSLLTVESNIKAVEGEKLAIIVVLRSGLAMFEPFMESLPNEITTVTFHIGIFRDQGTLQPVQYYNRLPPKQANIKQAYVLDPSIATGGTSSTVIKILKDWGVQHVTYVSLLASADGLKKVAGTWPESTQFVVGTVDAGLNDGHIEPGFGDIGDRLFGTHDGQTIEH